MIIASGETLDDAFLSSAPFVHACSINNFIFSYVTLYQWCCRLCCDFARVCLNKFLFVCDSASVTFPRESSWKFGLCVELRLEYLNTLIVAYDFLLVNVFLRTVSLQVNMCSSYCLCSLSEIAFLLSELCCPSCVEILLPQSRLNEEKDDFEDVVSCWY